MRTADRAAKQFKNMFADYKIVHKYRCGRMKTTHMLTRAVAKQIASWYGLLTRWYGLATDGSSDRDDKFLPVLARQVDKILGLIATSYFTCIA